MVSLPKVDFAGQELLTGYNMFGEVNTDCVVGYATVDVK
jgi:hypothetical protein